jgi:hypothetical protein
MLIKSDSVSSNQYTTPQQTGIHSDLHERRSIRLKQPLGNRLELPGLCDHNPLLIIRLGQVHVHLADGLQALQGHVAEHVGLDAAEEHVVLHLVGLILVVLLALLAVHDADPEDQLLGVVVVEDAVQIIAESWPGKRSVEN